MDETKSYECGQKAFKSGRTRDAELDFYWYGHVLHVHGEELFKLAEAWRKGFDDAYQKVFGGKGELK